MGKHISSGSVTDEHIQGSYDISLMLAPFTDVSENSAAPTQQADDD